MLYSSIFVAWGPSSTGASPSGSVGRDQVTSRCPLGDFSAKGRWTQKKEYEEVSEESRLSRFKHDTILLPVNADNILPSSRLVLDSGLLKQYPSRFILFSHIQS